MKKILNNFVNVKIRNGKNEQICETVEIKKGKTNKIVKLVNLIRKIILA